MINARLRPASTGWVLLSVVLMMVLSWPPVASAATKLGVAAACSGNTLSGTVTVSGYPAGSVVTVRAQQQTAGWTSVGAPVTFTVVAGQTSYALSFNVAGSTGVKGYRLVADGGAGPVASDSIKASTCGPPAQVPEVPAPLVIPLTMLLTAAGWEALRRRRPAVTTA